VQCIKNSWTERADPYTSQGKSGSRRSLRFGRPREGAANSSLDFTLVLPAWHFARRHSSLRRSGRLSGNDAQSMFPARGGRGVSPSLPQKESVKIDQF